MDTPQLRLRRKAGGAPPDAFGRGEALDRSWCENKESGLCFLKDQADSSVGNARGEARTAGGQKDDRDGNVRLLIGRLSGRALGTRPVGGGVNQSRVTLRILTPRILAPPRGHSGSSTTSMRKCKGSSRRQVSSTVLNYRNL